MLFALEWSKYVWESIIKQPIEHIVWDWNGTLIDDIDMCLGIMNSMLAPRDLPTMDRAYYLEHFDFPVQHFYEVLGFDLEKESMAALSEIFISSYAAQRENWTLHADVKATLDKHKAAGVGQSILSAYPHDELRTVISSFGIDAYFGDIQGVSDKQARGKVEQGRELVARLELSGHTPSSMLFVGDTLHDAEVAADLGISAVLVARGHQSKQRLQASGVTVLDDLSALEGYL